jgi:hypothetical protein
MTVVGVASAIPGVGRPRPSPVEALDRHSLGLRLLRVLATAERAVEFLIPAGWNDPNDPDVSVRSEKVLAETALLLLAAAPVAAACPSMQTVIDRIAVRLLPHATGANVRAALCTDPTMALDHAFASICLRKLGHEDTGFTRFLLRCLTPAGSPGRERVPHRAIEQHWLMRLALEPPDDGDRLELCRRSVLGTGIDVLSNRREDLYALTHAIMYATDLGEDRITLPRPGKVIAAELDAAVAVSLDRQDYDLAGELLACQFMIGQAPTATTSFGLNVLLAVEDESGFLPAPSLRLARLSELEGSDRSRYLLAASYHTIYVMGLLCAQLLRNGSHEPRSVDPVCSEIVESVSDIHGDQDRHWQQVYAECDEYDQRAYIPVLISIALHRAVAGSDLTKAAAIVAESHSAGYESLAAVIQTRQLLMRAANAYLA